MSKWFHALCHTWPCAGGCAGGRVLDADQIRGRGGGGACQTLLATSWTLVLNHCLLSHMASYDVASSICVTCHLMDTRFEPLFVESYGNL
jgi:hypothetical protein